MSKALLDIWLQSVLFEIFFSAGPNFHCTDSGLRLQLGHASAQAALVALVLPSLVQEERRSPATQHQGQVGLVLVNPRSFEQDLRWTTELFATILLGPHPFIDRQPLTD